MLTEHRKKQISTFTGVIFAAGVAVAGFDVFKPLLALLKDQQLTMSLKSSAPHEQVTESVQVADTNLTALVDASTMPTWSVIVYGLGVVLSIAGFLALIVGYATFIASAGENMIASNRWPMTIAISGLASLVCGLSGGWLTGWIQNHTAEGQGLTYYGYALNEQ